MSTTAPPVAYGVWFFKVDVLEKTVGSFTSVRGLEAQVDYLEYREGGVNNVVYRLPGPIRYPNLVFSQGLTQEGVLEQWLSSGGLAPTCHTIVVTLCDANGSKVRAWSFANAYPVRWTGPMLDYTGGMIAGEELEIVHQGLLADVRPTNPSPQVSANRPPAAAASVASAPAPTADAQAALAGGTAGPADTQDAS